MGKVIDDKELIAALRNAMLPVTYAYIADRLEQLTSSHSVTDEMVECHIDYLNDIGVYGLSKEGCRAALEAALSPQEPVAGDLPVVAWASQYSLDLVKEHPDQAWSMWGRPGGQATIPMTDHTEATRIIAELRAERDEAVKGRRIAEEVATACSKQGDKDQALIAELTEALEPFANYKSPHDHLDIAKDAYTILTIPKLTFGDFRKAHAVLKGGE